MVSYHEAYSKLIDLMKLFQEKTGKIPGGLVGLAGECWFAALLDNHEIEFTPKFGQYRYDIELKENKERVEIKTSNLKSLPDGKYYAWLIKKKPGELNFDKLVLVALPPNLEGKPRLFGFTREEVKDMPRPTNMGGNPYRGVMVYEHEIDSKLGGHEVRIEEYSQEAQC